MEDCISLIDDSDDDKDEQINELNYHIELLKRQKRQFLNLEVETERSASRYGTKMLSFQDSSFWKRSMY